MFKSSISKIAISSLLLVSILSISACTDSNKSAKGSKTDSEVTLKLVTYDSFPEKDAGVNKALSEFEKETGIKVKIVNAGDAGTMVSKAVLTSGKPEGDVIFGVDNTLLSRALKGDIFKPYISQGSKNMSTEFTKLIEKSAVTPVDYGDVCVNYDVDWFSEKNLEVPASLEDLAKPEYKDLLAVEDPASSSPGLAFLLATIDRFGEDKFIDYWQELRDNGVEVSNSWDTAYYQLFSGSAGKGKFPMVVSYATSPAAEIIYAEKDADVAPTASITDTCFRQVEFAGILRGTKHEEQAGKLIDFLISEKFQKEIPLSLFVYPTLDSVEIPKEFKEFAVEPIRAVGLTPKVIEANSEKWIESWTQTVLR